LNLSNCKCGDENYFDALVEQLNTDSANIFYNYLLNIDISSWKKLKIPNTELRNELKINSLPKPVQFLVKCIEGEIDTINLRKNKSSKVHTNHLYELFIDYFGFRNKMSKIDFSRQLNKFGLKSKAMKIEGYRLKGYVLDYNEIMTKLKNLKIDIKEEEHDAKKNDIEEQKNDIEEIDTNIFRISDLDF